MASHLGWTPREFWSATFHDMTTAMWARKRTTAPKSKKEMSPQQVMSLFAGMAGGKAH